LYLLLAVFVWLPYNQAYYLVHPARVALFCEAEAEALGMQPVAFQTDDGLTLRGWYLPPRNGALIVYVHGLRSNRCNFLPEAEALSADGCGALLFDLRGHGTSDAAASTLGLDEQRDVRAALDFVHGRPGVERIAVYGHSMGAAAVLLAVPDRPEVDAVITASTYTSVDENLVETIHAMTGLPAFPFAPLVTGWGEILSGADLDALRPVDTIAALSPRPVLVLHGEQDELVPVANAHALYAAAGEPKRLYLVRGGVHSSLLWDDPGYRDALRAFLAEFLLP